MYTNITNQLFLCESDFLILGRDILQKQLNRGIIYFGLWVQSLQSITLSSVSSGPVLRQNFMAVGQMAELLTCGKQEVQRGGKELGTSYFPKDQLPDLLPPVRPHLLPGPSNLLTLRLENQVIHQHVGRIHGILGGRGPVGHRLTMPVFQKLKQDHQV